MADNNVSSRWGRISWSAKHKYRMYLHRNNWTRGARCSTQTIWRRTHMHAHQARTERRNYKANACFWVGYGSVCFEMFILEWTKRIFRCGRLSGYPEHGYLAQIQRKWEAKRTKHRKVSIIWKLSICSWTWEAQFSIFHESGVSLVHSWSNTKCGNKRENDEQTPRFSFQF